MVIDWVPIVAIIMGTLMILIPVSLVALRFAIKPISEAVAKMRGGGASQQELAIMKQQIALLEQQLGGMESELHRLSEAQEFQAQLLKPAGD
jgi:TolA-binding protein